MLYVIIDCGHNEESVGAVSDDGKIMEYQYVREIGLHLHRFIMDDNDMYCKYLHNVNHRQGETERDDLNGRVRLYNKMYDELKKSDSTSGCVVVLVTLHCDSSSNKDARGVSIFVGPNASKNSRKLAVHSENVMSERGFKYNRTYSYDTEHCRTRDIAVLRDTKMPAVLYECMFLSNKDDVELLKMPNTPKAIAGAIYASLRRFIFF